MKQIKKNEESLPGIYWILLIGKKIPYHKDTLHRIKKDDVGH